MARNCRAVLSAQYTSARTRERAGCSDWVPLWCRATAPLPANGPRLCKPHPGKSRPRCAARSFMWPGFRASPRPPASRPAASGIAPPSPAQPRATTQATWGARPGSQTHREGLPLPTPVPSAPSHFSQLSLAPEVSTLRLRPQSEPELYWGATP